MKLSKSFLPISLILLITSSAVAVPTAQGLATADHATDDLTLVTPVSILKVSGKAAEESSANEYIVKNDPLCVLVMLAKFDNDNDAWEEVYTGFDTSWLSGVAQNEVPAEFSWNLASSGFELYGVLTKVANDMDIYKVNTGKGIAGNGKVDSPITGKGFSHIAFFGKKAGTSVPDTGSTLVLLGLGLGVLGFLKRRK